MINRQKFKSTILSLLGLLALCVVCISLVIILNRFQIMSATESISIAVALFFVLFFALRHNRLARDVSMLKAQAQNLDTYEQDIEQRLRQFSQQIAEQTPPSPSVSPMETQELKSLTKRIEALEESSLGFGEAASNDGSSPKVRSPLSPNPKSIAAGMFSAHSAKNDADKTASMKSALSDKSLSMHLQPIVDLHTRQPQYFDAFMRLKTSGQTYLDQSEFGRIAREGKLNATIDKKIVLSAVRMLRKLLTMKKRTGVFCQISAATLSNTRTYNEIVRFLEANKSICEALIIDLTQREYSSLDATQKERLGAIADLGVPLSLSNVLDLSLDGKTLSDFGFRFVRIPVTVLIHSKIDEQDGVLHPSSLSTALQEHSIEVIAMDVERDNDAVSLIDLDISLAHGLLFAPPRPVKAELLEAPKASRLGRKKKLSA